MIDKKTGETLLLSEWVIHPKNNTELNQVLRQLSSIEQELNYLTKLKHYNLSHYLCLKYEQFPDGKVTVHILKEFINGKII